MRVLITGAAGYIGSHVTIQALLDNHVVVTLDAQPLPTHSPSNLVHERVNLLNPQTLNNVLIKHKPHAVIHLAALTLVDESIQKPIPYFQHNLVATLNLLNSMIAAQTQILVFSSTCAVYDQNAQQPLNELSLKNPQHPYGTSKLAAENLIQHAARAHNLKTIALRYFNAAGAHTQQLAGFPKNDPHLIPKVLHAALNNSPFSLFGNQYPTPDKTTVRDYIHVCDIARAHSLALNYLNNNNAPNFTPLNIGTGYGASILQILNVARNITQKPIPAVHKPPRDGDPPTLVANAEKARNVLGFSPQLSDIHSIVQDAWKWIQSPKYDGN